MNHSVPLTTKTMIFTALPFSFTCFECTARFTLCNLNKQDSFTFPPTCRSLRVEGQHHYMLSHRERKRPAAAAAEARQLFIAKSS